MLKFFQFFGLGLLYTLLLPFLLVFLALFSAYSILMMVFFFFKMIILFFAGRNIFKEFPEDIEARQTLVDYRSLKKAEKDEQKSSQAYPFPYPFQFTPPPHSYGYINPHQVIDGGEIKEVESTPVNKKDDDIK